ncbi:hypothetical protein BLOT_011165 [Blomia tropicalis]|nr:hypothetical protein BLOT_011165 [Blomia tropicalis]
MSLYICLNLCDNYSVVPIASLALSNNAINLLKISTLLKHTAICKAFIFNLFFFVNINFLTNPFSNFLQLVNKKLTIFKFPSFAAKSNAYIKFIILFNPINTFLRSIIFPKCLMNKLQTLMKKSFPLPIPYKNHSIEFLNAFAQH